MLTIHISVDSIYLIVLIHVRLFQYLKLLFNGKYSICEVS